MIPSDIECEREICTQSLREYVQAAWPQVEPARVFMSNYHIDAICEHLEAVTKREIRRLVINVPPGSMKSLLCGVFWPSWSWISNPQLKWITASYSDRVARRDSLRARQLMESPWYQKLWGDVWKPKEPWAGGEYRNTRGGFRFSTTVGGAVCGEHADHQLADDPIKPLDARGAAVDTVALKSCIEWWDETMTTRVVDPAKSTRTIIMQRLHDRDLSGHVLAGGEYTHLCLPMRYEPRCVISVSHPCALKADAKGEPTPATPKGYKDPREEGELLWPERFPEAVQVERKRELGSRGVAAQDQQRPVPSGGGIFKREWVQHWRAYPKIRATYIQSWDCAFKGLDTSDHVVGQVWARVGGNYYLVDQVRDRMSVSRTCKAILSLSSKWRKARRKLIEDKANGPAVIDLLKGDVPGLQAVNPQGGKVARANAVEPLWEAMNVWLPHPDVAPWVHDFVEELVSFDGQDGREDDQVDAMTQALVHLHDRTAERYRAMVEAMVR